MWRRHRASVNPPTDPAAGAAAPGVRAPGEAPVGTALLRRRLRDAGDADARNVHLVSGGTDVGGVGRGAGPRRLVSRKQEEVFQVDVSLLLKGVVFLWRDARGVALSSAHHLESRAGVYKTTRTQVSAAQTSEAAFVEAEEKTLQHKSSTIL